MAGRSALTASRRVVAAAMAGYYCHQCLAAVARRSNSGLQPLFFTTPRGAPLYAPYPLRIAIPAMMIGHLTVAGLAELVLSAGVVAYLQRTNPGLLKLTAPANLEAEPQIAGGESPSMWRTVRPLWIALALLMVLTPLGILGRGNRLARVEREGFFESPSPREMAAASRNADPPVQPPRGLERLSSLWTAPFPQYAPSFVRRPAVGYALSAMFGSGAIILVSLAAGSLSTRGRARTQVSGARCQATQARCWVLLVTRHLSLHL